MVSTASWAGSAGYAAPDLRVSVWIQCRVPARMLTAGREPGAVHLGHRLFLLGQGRGERLGHLMPCSSRRAGDGSRPVSQEGQWLAERREGRESLVAPGAGLFKDDCSSHGHVRSRRYGTHRLVEVMNVPREGGVMSGKLMTGMERSAARVAPLSRWGSGGRRGAGEAGTRAPGQASSPRRRQEAAGPQDCGICWQRVGLGGSLAAALCSVRKLYSYCGGTDRQRSVWGTRACACRPARGAAVPAGL